MYDPYYYVFTSAEDTSIIRDIEKAVSGEYNAILCYAKLAEMAPNEEEQERILEIRQDEVRHYQIFSQIYTRLTGKKPTVTEEECPDCYKEGLDFAFKDEQNTVDFYQNIADRAKDLHVKQQFRRAAFDEQNHAVWFLYYMNKHCRHDKQHGVKEDD
ncbi:ferritin family protein [Hazenella coriacea]|uniref:Rubrerythrin n=1 Tax=Hazenella coriacea TaxID=1179467 RepID=A0A4R3L876_9BACL|nr:ferritin-like domain-containing protein [Hazenella coriacea]TCS95762.1 rubrerythrin [Hazenella coriacea]